MRYYYIYFVFMLALGSLHAQDSESLKAKINLIQDDIFVKIDAVVENTDHLYNKKLNYYLLILKKKGSSKSYAKSDQQGYFEILPNEKKTISSLRINIEKDQVLKVYLFIKDQSNVIAQDSVSINEINEILKTNFINEVDIEITGLVVENVKTKIGKDFYDFFYQKYNRSDVKYSFVINVNEKPFIGRGSIISIEIEGDKIFEFQAKPDDELLNNTAEYTLKLIANYSKNRTTYEKKY